MSNVKNILAYLKSNLAELYTLLVIAVLVPVAISLLTSYKWGLLVSFLSQATIGILYIKGKTK